MSLRHVGLIVHPRRDARQVLLRVAEWARGHGVTVAGLAHEDTVLPPGFERRPESELAGDADLVVGLGGDGTILRALRLAAPFRVPVLGAQLGRVGFLAEVQCSELPEALERVASGDFRVERRCALDLRRPGRERQTAYNDVALARVPGHGAAAFEVIVDGEVFARYAADALVVSTPTGSTAYSFAAGGPIMSPRFEAVLVTPVAPHGPFDRTVVLHPDEDLLIRMLPRSAGLLIEIDGVGAGEAAVGDELAIGTRAGAALVVRLNGTSFFAKARAKLRLVDAAEIEGG